MTPENKAIKCQALMVQAMACNARIEAMKVANDHARVRGHAEPPFPYGLMKEQVDNLDHISRQLDRIAEASQPHEPTKTRFPSPAGQA